MEIPAGRIRLTASPRPDTTVEIRGLNKSGEEYAESISVQHSGDTISILGPRQSLMRSPSVEVLVALPAGSHPTVKTASADISLHGPFDVTRLHTASGDIHFDRLGATRIKTASGDVAGDVIEGDADITTASGDVRIASITGDAKIDTASGEYTLRHVAGDITAKSASGDLDFTNVQGRSLNARTASGDVTVGIPDGMDVSLSMEADDVTPNRITAAKRAAQQFALDLP
ncbi:DUF4097 family beta strand repeat-containing protein, partial [Nonomuraea sp. NPDC050310]|uniref:DUF4097 family beta strand repeat-containing protein n=1 Tax=Nonomuraea sp. NPDC050310 TaxID=3154935 RepID=UPI0033EABC76